MGAQRKSPGEPGPERAWDAAFGNNHTAAGRLLQRLDKVRETGAGQWIACCPAHDDRSPSLSIKQADDRLLIHCFAGCETQDIVHAVGLEFADLFDRSLEHRKSPLKPYQRQRQGQALEALQSLRVEALVVLIAADRMSAGQRLGWRDTDRLHDAFDRVRAACELVGARYKDTKLPGHPSELRQPSEYKDEIIEYMGKVSRGEAPE